MRVIPKSTGFALSIVVCFAAGHLIADQLVKPSVDGSSTVSRGGDSEQGFGAEMLVGNDENGGFAAMVQEPPRRTSRRPIWPKPGDINKRSNSLMLQTFEEVVQPSVPCTARLSVQGVQVALATVVDRDGWIVTKASQLPFVHQTSTRPIDCNFADGATYDATVHSVDQELDIALLKVNATNLTPVAWDSAVPDRGNWLASTDVYRTPASVGVASVGLQEVPRSRAVLGVMLGDAEILFNGAVQRGAQVRDVLPTSGAREAGVLKDDVIIGVNGKAIDSHSAFMGHVQDGWGGQNLELAIVRNDRRITINARLMDLSEELLDETEMEVSGRVSHRSSGFKSVLMHDSVISPNQCGGPIVNLDGKVVGINIARAGRVSTYALPATVLKPRIESLLSQAKLVSRTESKASAVR